MKKTFKPQGWEQPAAPDSILRIPESSFGCRWDLLTSLVGGKWSEAWKCWSNKSSTGKFKKCVENLATMVWVLWVEVVRQILCIV